MMAALSDHDSPFRVIIVGGSIAGLVLAHCLDKSGIDYVVLEGRPEIAPRVGASVGIMPNGARILDQLALFDTVEKEIEPLVRSHICYPDGFEFSSIFPELFHKRFGYPIAFLDRHRFLEILYNALRDKSRVRLGTRVTGIERAEHSVCVHTADNGLYHGDLVVGADGVHSRVRAEMWRLAECVSPGLISDEERTAMSAEYVCVFGISSPLPQLLEGEAIACFYDGRTILTNHGKDGRVFWFVLQKMERKHFYPNIPRFDDIDAEKICARLYDSKVWKEVRFQQIWDAREIHSIVALEENVFDHWHYDRIVCLGDSMHKMTPNIGQGANTAIESAAALANHLQDMIKARKIKSPTDTQVETCLDSFANSRIQRARDTVKSSGFLTRLQARDGIFNRLLGRYIIPYAGDFPANHGGSVIRAAPKLDFLPLPRRLGTHWETKARRPFFWAEWIKGAALRVLRNCAYSGALMPALPVPAGIQPA